MTSRPAKRRKITSSSSNEVLFPPLTLDQYRHSFLLLLPCFFLDTLQLQYFQKDFELESASFLSRVSLDSNHGAEGSEGPSESTAADDEDEDVIMFERGIESPGARSQLLRQMLSRFLLQSVSHLDLIEKELLTLNSRELDLREMRQLLETVVLVSQLSAVKRKEEKRVVSRMGRKTVLHSLLFYFYHGSVNLEQMKYRAGRSFKELNRRRDEEREFIEKEGIQSHVSLGVLMVPMDVMIEILSFLRHDYELLSNVGLVCEDWFVAVLLSWRSVTVCHRTIMSASLVALKNVETFSVCAQTGCLSSQTASRHGWSYFLQSIVPEKIRVIDLSHSSARPIHLFTVFLRTVSQHRIVFSRCVKLTLPDFFRRDRTGEGMLDWGGRRGKEIRTSLVMWRAMMKSSDSFSKRCVFPSLHEVSNVLGIETALFLPGTQLRKLDRLMILTLNANCLNGNLAECEWWDHLEELDVCVVDGIESSSGVENVAVPGAAGVDLMNIILRKCSSLKDLRIALRLVFEPESTILADVSACLSLENVSLDSFFEAALLTSHGQQLRSFKRVCWSQDVPDQLTIEWIESSVQETFQLQFSLYVLFGIGGIPDILDDFLSKRATLPEMAEFSIGFGIFSVLKVVFSPSEILVRTDRDMGISQRLLQILVSVLRSSGKKRLLIQFQDHHDIKKQDRLGGLRQVFSIVQRTMHVEVRELGRTSDGIYQQWEIVDLGKVVIDLTGD